MEDFSFETSNVALFLRTVAQALHLAQRHIQHLHVEGLLPELIQNTEPLRHLFTGLESIILDMRGVEFLREGMPPSAMTYLFECARPTVRSIKIMGSYYPHLPERGVHSVANLFFNQDGKTPKVFPHLQSLYLRTLIISTQPFIDFLAAQPNISNLRVYYVYLATPSLGWLHVATSLPATVLEWTVGNLGHEPVPGYVSPIAYNWTKIWRAWEEPLLHETGWKGSFGLNKQGFIMNRIS